MILSVIYEQIHHKYQYIAGILWHNCIYYLFTKSCFVSYEPFIPRSNLSQKIFISFPQRGYHFIFFINYVDNKSFLNKNLNETRNEQFHTI